MPSPLLDDPALFWTWGRIVAGQDAAYLEWLAAEYGIPPSAALQLFGAKAGKPELAQLHSAYGWLEIPDLLARLPAFVERASVRVGAGAWAPSAAMAFCAAHALHYNAEDGRPCPVCSDNYIALGRHLPGDEHPA